MHEALFCILYVLEVISFHFYTVYSENVFSTKIEKTTYSFFGIVEVSKDLEKALKVLQQAARRREEEL